MRRGLTTGEAERALAPGALAGSIRVIGASFRLADTVVYDAVDGSGREVWLHEYWPRRIAARGAGGRIEPALGDWAGQFDAGRRDFIDTNKRLARAGGHPNVLRVLKAVEGDAGAFAVTERLAGQPLTDRLADAAFDGPAHALTTAEQLTAALHHLHGRGLIHGSLSPEAVFCTMDEPWSLVVAGMGAGLPGPDSTAYLPIERFDDPPTTGRSGDVFAASAILYRMVVGRPRLDARQRLFREADRTAVALGSPDAPRAFLAAIDRGLELAAEDRPATIEAFRESLGLSRTPRKARQAKPAAAGAAAALPSPSEAVAIAAAEIGPAIAVTTPTAAVDLPAEPRQAPASVEPVRTTGRRPRRRLAPPKPSAVTKLDEAATEVAEPRPSQIVLERAEPGRRHGPWLSRTLILSAIALALLGLALLWGVVHRTAPSGPGRVAAIPAAPKVLVAPLTSGPRRRPEQTAPGPPESGRSASTTTDAPTPRRGSGPDTEFSSRPIRSNSVDSRRGPVVDLPARNKCRAVIRQVCDPSTQALVDSTQTLTQISEIPRISFAQSDWDRRFSIANERAAAVCQKTGSILSGPAQLSAGASCSGGRCTTGVGFVCSRTVTTPQWQTTPGACHEVAEKVCEQVRPTKSDRRAGRPAVSADDLY